MHGSLVVVVVKRVFVEVTMIEATYDVEALILVDII